MINVILSFLVALSLAGCASVPEKISTTPTGATAPIQITNPTIITDLQSATENLDDAVRIGALPADDPAPKCLHDLLQRAGIEARPGAAPIQSFEPKNDGIASLGSIVYIQVQQAKAIAGQITPPSRDCTSLIGTFVIDGATALSKTLPARGLIRLLR